jgi:hypothetical protein
MVKIGDELELTALEQGTYLPIDLKWRQKGPWLFLPAKQEKCTYKLGQPIIGLEYLTSIIVIGCGIG